MKRSAKIALVAAPLLLFGSGVAYAAIPDSDDGEYHACRANVGGALRMIDKQAGENCLSGETEEVWNQTGPTGPTGATGPQGPAGPMASTYVDTETGSGASGDETASCTSGDKLLSASAHRDETNPSETFPLKSYVLNGSSEPVGANFNVGGGAPYKILLVCIDL